MFTQFANKHKLWLIAGIVLLVINLAVLFLVTMPKINYETLNRDSLLQLQKNQVSLNKALETRRELRTFVETRLKDLMTFYEDILGQKEDKLNSILKERQDIANKFGIVPERVSYNETLMRGLPMSEMVMSFPLKGTYGSFRFFIDNIEHSNNFFIIKDIELTGAEEEANGEMSMRITVSTLFHDTTPREGLDEDYYTGEEADETI